MTTARELCTASLRLIRVYGATDTPSAEDADATFDALNLMIQAWNTERLMIYEVKQIGPYTLTAADGAYTIGSGGDFNVTRPQKIEAAWFTDSGSISYPLKIVDASTWARITEKTIQSYPMWMWYDTAYTLGTLNFWPVPSDTFSFYAMVWTQFSAFASLDTAISLPDGYERALKYNLAMEICDEFGRDVTPNVARIATHSKATLKRLNTPVREMQVDRGLRRNGGFWTIYGDTVT